MSTKATIFLDEINGIHMYHEGLDGRAHIEFEHRNLVLDVTVMASEEWEAMAHSVDVKAENARLTALVENYRAQFARQEKEIKALQERIFKMTIGATK